jgi:TonB family protein
MAFASEKIRGRHCALAVLGCLAAVSAGWATGQEAAPAAQAAQQAVPAAADAASQAPALAASKTPASEHAKGGGISEDELRQMLVGKTFYLRGGYLDDSLNFSEHGGLIGHSPQGSYTLCMVEIDKVHLTKHKVELDGVRYGMHFLGALPYEDPTKAVDRVRITPKKKELRITIDRELVVKPKKQKAEKPAKGATANAGGAAKAAGSPPPASASASAAPTEQTANAQEPESTDADEMKKEIAAAPAAERPADPASLTTTTSPEHATKVLNDAIQNVFAPGLDERMMAAMPDFWKLYYRAAAAKTDYRPDDPAVMGQTAVDRKARLITNFEPESNEYAQDAGVAGMALYHAVIGADGKPGEVAVARPIGFGLDENAVAAIRNAKFDPALKDGKPVPVLLDLVVEFRIYSKRTAASGPAEQADKPAAPSLPGPYSAQHQSQQ